MEHHRLKRRNAVGIALLAATGALFVLKYGARVTSYSPLTAVLYAIGYIGTIYVLASRRRKVNRIAARNWYIVVVVLLVGTATALVLVTPSESRVARRIALQEGIARILTGRFPWGAATETNPSGFPGLFALALPFYLVGHVGLLGVVGLGFFGWAATKYTSRATTPWVRLIALLGLPPFYYELLVRSELLFNMMLAIGLILVADRDLKKSERGSFFYEWAVLFGLVLSTRAVVGLVWAAYYAYRFRERPNTGAYFAGISALAFLATLFPFVLWDAGTFFREGPFAVQSSPLPTPIAILFGGIALIVGMKADQVDELLHRTGVLLFLTVAVAFVLTIVVLDFRTAIFGSGFDVGYFILCVPFLLLGLKDSK